MNSPVTSLETFFLLAPELVLIAAALATFLEGAFGYRRSGWLAAFVGIYVAMLFAGDQPNVGSWVNSGGICIDAFSAHVRSMVLTLGALLCLVQAGDMFPTAATRSGIIRAGSTCEEAGTFLVLLAGLSLATVAGDLVLLFVGLEMVSIPTYILLALKRTDAAGQEAGLKYFYLSLVASALFLYAAVTLYGIGGSTSLADIGDRLRSVDPSLTGTAAVLLPVAIGMTLAGAAFRLAAVPMHYYAPDVYQGTSPANAALLATLPKVAGIVVLVRVLALAIPSAAAFDTPTGGAAEAHLSLFWKVTAILAAVTMTVGNVMALMQRNLRRLLACSSIAHAGYLLVGIAAAAAAESARSGPAGVDTTWTMALGGIAATLFYLAIYSLATIGVFAALTYLGHRWPEWTATSGPRPPREEIASVEDLDGLSSTNPVAAFAIALFLLSLAGIPPLPGFWGKLMLATSALEVDWNAAIELGSRRCWFVSLAVLLVLNAAIAAAYYLRVIAAMYFRPMRKGVQADGGLSAGIAMLICTALLLAASVQPLGLFASSSRAGDAIEKNLR